MRFKIICILLLIKTLKINATEKINLPQGFNPEPSPMNPLLYPFVFTQTDRAIVATTTSGWRPVITHRTTTQSPLLTSMMEDPFNNVPLSREEEDEGLRRADPHAMESIVYGVWKSEQPLKPKLSQSKTISHGIAPNHRNVIRRRLGGFIEEKEHRETIEDSSEKNPSAESKNEDRSNKGAFRKQGRRKILNFNKNRNNNSTQNEKQNSSYHQYRNITKEIKESLDPVNVVNMNKNSSTEESYAPRLRNSNNKISKQWPIDFTDSNEDSRTDNLQNIIEDNTEAPRPVVNINLDELLGSKTSFNITKMGIPYEDQNSSEEPSICVPLAVREHSVSNPNEIVDVERVYCFPLPPVPDTDRIHQNKTFNLDKKSRFRIQSSQEYSTPSRGVHITGATAISLIIFSFLLN